MKLLVTGEQSIWLGILLSKKKDASEILLVKKERCFNKQMAESQFVSQESTKKCDVCWRHDALDKTRFHVKLQRQS